jgi:hypothetical protein
MSKVSVKFRKSTREVRKFSNILSGCSKLLSAITFETSLTLPPLPHSHSRIAHMQSYSAAHTREMSSRHCHSKNCSSPSPLPPLLENSQEFREILQELTKHIASFPPKTRTISSLRIVKRRFDSQNFDFS